MPPLFSANVAARRALNLENDADLGTCCQVVRPIDGSHDPRHGGWLTWADRHVGVLGFPGPNIEAEVSLLTPRSPDLKVVDTGAHKAAVDYALSIASLA